MDSKDPVWPGKKTRYEIAKLPGHQNHDIQQTTSFQHLAPSCQAWLMNRSQSKPSGCCIKAQLTLPACSVTGLMYCSWLSAAVAWKNMQNHHIFYGKSQQDSHSLLQVWRGYGMVSALNTISTWYLQPVHKISKLIKITGRGWELKILIITTLRIYRFQKKTAFHHQVSFTL